MTTCYVLLQGEHCEASCVLGVFDTLEEALSALELVKSEMAKDNSRQWFASEETCGKMTHVHRDGCAYVGIQPIEKGKLFRISGEPR